MKFPSAHYDKIVRPRRDPWANMTPAEKHADECRRVMQENAPINDQIRDCWRQHDAAAKVGDVAEQGRVMMRLNYLDEMLKPLPLL